MIIGAQGFTIREFTKNEQSITQSFQKLREIGFQSVQVSAFGEIEPQRLREIADETQIQIIVTHTNQDKILNSVDQVIEEHKILGCSHVGIGMMPNRYMGSLEGVRGFIKDYDYASRKLADHGMKLHYHNHGFEFQRFDGICPYEVLLNETSPDLWGMILDVYWVQVGGHNPANFIRQMKGRIDICHLKDLAINGFEQNTAPVGEGNLDWDLILTACNEAGISYGMIEQDNTYGKYPFAELQKSATFLTNKGMPLF